MEQNVNAIAALERVLLTVEAELTALHTGEAVDRADLETRLRTDLTAASAAVPRPAPAPIRQLVATLPPPPPPSPGAPTPIPQHAPPPPAPPRPVPAQPFRPQAAAPSAFEPRPVPPRNSIGLERIFRLGGISLVVMAAVFFVSTAISRGWIGPTAQLTLAALTSLALIAQSFRFPTEQRAWRSTMAIGGSACLFVTGVIGHFGLDILGMDATMAWLGATVLGFLALGRAHDHEVIAAAGAPAALFGTLLFTLSGDATAPIVLGLGALWTISLGVATFDQRWFGARASGGAIAAMIIAIGALLEPGDVMTDVGALIGIGAMVALGATQLREYTIAAANEGLSALAQFEARLAATITPWVAFIAAVLLQDSADFFDAPDSTGWMAVAIGFVFAAGATALSTRVHPTMTMLHQLAGIGTASVGLIAVLDGPALIAALLVQASITGALAYRTSLIEMMVGASILFTIPALWTLTILTQGVAGETLDAAEIIVSGAVVALVAAATFVLQRRPNLSSAWIVGWGLYLFWVAASLQGLPQTQMAISLAWAASAVLLIVTRKSAWSEHAAAQGRMVINVALGTLLVTGAKLVFVDLVTVDVLWRAALFLLIGATFLRLAFVLPSILEADSQDPNSGVGDEVETPKQPGSM